MIDALPPCWQSALAKDSQEPYYRQLHQFVCDERQRHQVFPDNADVFNALRLTPLSQVRVLILGQDPYHDDNQAHGLSFSVRRGIKLPPSLRNIFKELESDLGIAAPSHGCLEAWARQGVLLLNTVLTVRAHEPNSHSKHGWEEFTTRVIASVNERPLVAFVLWGRLAQQKATLVHDRHLVISTAHPSPLSARRGFFGSQPFSKVNDFLTANGQQAIDWQLND